MRTLSLIALLVTGSALAQTSPAVRRSTPLSDDLGMVVRPIPSGTQNVNVVGGGGVSAQPDGGLIGSVMQATFPWLIAGADGGAVPISGSITASNPSVGATGAATPVSATLIGGTDGTNLLAPYVITTTPDAGDPGLVVRVVGGISGGGSGGAVTQGTTPWLIAGVDAGAVPVQGTVAATQSGTWNVTNVSGTVSLPTGAATEATLATRAADSTITARLNTLGQKTMVNSAPVVIASDQSAVPVSGSVTASGTVTANQGTPAVTANAWPSKLVDSAGTNVATVSAAGALKVDGSAVTQPVSGTVTVAQAVAANLNATVTGTVNAAQSGTWAVRTQDGAGNALASSTAAPVGTEQALIVRNIPSGTQAVSGTVAVSGTTATNVSQFGGSAVVTGTGTSGAGIPRVTVSSDSTVGITGNVTVTQATASNLRAQTSSESNTGAAAPTQGSLAMGNTTTVAPTYTNNTANALSLTTAGALRTDSSATTQPISGTVAATQSGTWAVRAQDGAGNALASSTAAPVGTEQALIVRNVPSGTQAVSGTVTANVGTTGGLALDSTLTGGTAKAVVRGGAKGTTTAADVTSTNVDANTQALDVSVKGTAAVSGTVAATQSGTWNITNVSGTVSLPTGAATEATLGTRLADATFTGRFGAASLLADATANPTLTAIAGFSMLYNGTTWDRARGTTANGLLVDVSRIAAGTNYIGKTRITDGTLDVSLLNSAPGSDTGQVSVPVRIISSLAGGAGGTSSSFGAAFPASGTAAGWSDGTNMQGARVFDADTGGGSQYVAGVNLRVSASGGSTEAAAGAGATSASTLRVVLPTDQTAIPVTDNGGSLTVDGTVALSGTSAVNVSQVGGNAVNVGSGAAGTGTQRVILATDQPVIPVSDNGGSITVDGTVAATQSGAWNVTNISGTVSLPTGAATETTLAKIPLAQGAATAGQSGTLVQAAVTTAAPTYTNGNSNPLSLTTAGALRTDSSATTQPVSGTVALSGTSAVNVSQYGGSAVGAANAVHVQPGTGASFTVAQATASNLRAQTSAESATAAAVPANAMQSGYRSTDGNLRPGLAMDVDTSGSTIYAQGTTIVGAQFGSALAAAVEASAIPGTSSGLVTRELKKHATSVVATAVSCGTSATAAPSSPLGNRFSICLYNNSTSTIFIGPAAVTTAAGLPLLPGASFCDDVNTTQVYSCIVASGTAELRVLEN